MKKKNIKYMRLNSALRLYAKWIPQFMPGYYKCSNCGSNLSVNKVYPVENFHYCWYCGCIMGKGDE